MIFGNALNVVILRLVENLKSKQYKINERKVNYMSNQNNYTMDRKEYIDFLANKSNEICMNNKNSKTGKKN